MVRGSVKTRFGVEDPIQVVGVASLNKNMYEKLSSGLGI